MTARRIVVTGSKAHRIVKCPASAAIPHVHKPDTYAAVRGRVIHKYLERARTVGVESALLEAAEELRPYLAAIDLDDLPSGLAAEVAFAWDWKARTGRELGRGLDRAYPELGPTEVALTTDLLGLDRARARVYIGDFKSGFTRYPRPGRFGQTLLGACAAAATYGVEDAEVELIYLDRDGDAWHVRDSVDAWELETFADEFQAAMELAIHYAGELDAGRPVQLREGDHCEHCPAFKQCPAKVALVRAALVGDVAADVKAPGYLAPDRLAETYKRIQILRDMLGQVESEIFGMAAFEPIDLGDGEVLGPVTTVRHKYNGEIAARVLEDMYDHETASAASKISISKERLREAVARHRKPKEKLSTKAGDGLVDRIEREIRARNGIEIDRVTKVRPHRPKAKRVLSDGD